VLILQQGVDFQKKPVGGLVVGWGLERMLIMQLIICGFIILGLKSNYLAQL
jgi:hypothetical protein